jgi:hypothetical protein
MKHKDLLELQSLYENAIFVARAIDLSPETHQPDMASDTESHNVEEKDPSEIHMVKAELKKLAEYSHKLYDMIDNVPELEGWVVSKITKASNHISSVYHWLEYGQDVHALLTNPSSSRRAESIKCCKSFR